MLLPLICVRKNGGFVNCSDEKTGENTVKLTGEPILESINGTESDDFLVENGYVSVSPIISSPLDELTYNKYKDFKF